MTHAEAPEVDRRDTVTAPAFHRPCWAEIDLAAFRYNWQLLRQTVPPTTQMLAVVKANAYGHGLIPLSTAAVEQGAVYLGVSSLEEGIAIRKAGIKAPVLILGSLFPFENFPVLFEYGLTPTIASLAAAEALSMEAVQRNASIAIHLEIDTGMGRTGISPESAGGLLQALTHLPGLKLEGIYTHLASADIDLEFAKVQVALFKGVIDKAAEDGVRPRWIHWGNSASLFAAPEGQPTLSRPGLALYGVTPFNDMPHADDLRPVLSWKTRVIFLKTVPKGTNVSYARSWTAQRPSRIATLAVGYADGLPRLLSNRGEALLRGQRVPIIGRVTMDMTMVDATDVPECAVGDEVALIGSQGNMHLTAAELARWAETSAYEILCGIDARVPRIMRNG